jgi:hypothetical protein
VIIKVGKALISRARKACLKIRKAFKVLKHRRHAGTRERTTCRGGKTPPHFAERNMIAWRAILQMPA